MAGQFLRAAQQGGVAGFAVDTDSARAMIMSIGDIRTEMKNKLREIDDLTTRAKLGDLPEAQDIAKLDADVAAGDQQSLAYVLGRFAEALDEADQALEIGMRNYEQIEAQAKQDFGGIDYP